MSRPRDSQQTKLYRAEGQVFTFETHLSLVQAQDLADRVVKSVDWRDLTKENGLNWALCQFVAVMIHEKSRTRGGHAGVFYRNGGQGHTLLEAVQQLGRPFSHARGLILLGSDYVSTELILHEMSHAATLDKEESHGWRFCRTYLALVRRFIGHGTAKALESSFKRNRVKYKAPRKFSPAAREVLRLRGLALAELQRKRRAGP